MILLGLSDVQPAPIRKTAPSGLSAASQLLLLIRRRSLREGIGVKIRASTIFTPVPSLAELGIYKKLIKAYFSLYLRGNGYMLQ